MKEIDFSYYNFFILQLLTFTEVNTISYQGDTEKYLTRGNLYHPRHTCITRDEVEGNTGVSRVIQVFEGQIISPYHPGNHVITTLSQTRNYRLFAKFYGIRNET